MIVVVKKSPTPLAQARGTHMGELSCHLCQLPLNKPCTVGQWSNSIAETASKPSTWNAVCVLYIVHTLFSLQAPALTPYPCFRYTVNQPPSLCAPSPHLVPHDHGILQGIKEYCTNRVLSRRCPYSTACTNVRTRADAKSSRIALQRVEEARPLPQPKIFSLVWVSSVRLKLIFGLFFTMSRDGLVLAPVCLR
ncbi:hypothetical protein BKA66DRAFT_75957 [Pyrenochaeta sp. MPI-SDFR-AT-0127]|nr:hypothetical protein BKA66DRAFT_75957 [Pyrenochaeta sp. MPI-SDFR-AT-0127]